jgi:Pyridoxamine 5'-phosphate oxidase
MLNDAVRSALTVEGPAAFVTTGKDGPHLVATWQSYLEVIGDSTLAFPAGGYIVTEANLKAGSSVQMVVGSKSAPGGGIGFRLTGTAELQYGNALHEQLKKKYPWCRAAVVMRVTGVEQILGKPAAR